MTFVCACNHLTNFAVLVVSSYTCSILVPLNTQFCAVAGTDDFSIVEEPLRPYLYRQEFLIVMIVTFIIIVTTLVEISTVYN